MVKIGLGGQKLHPCDTIRHFVMYSHCTIVTSTLSTVILSNFFCDSRKKILWFWTKEIGLKQIERHPYLTWWQVAPYLSDIFYECSENTTLRGSVSCSNVRWDTVQARQLHWAEFLAGENKEKLERIVYIEENGYTDTSHSHTTSFTAKIYILHRLQRVLIDYKVSL